MQNRWSPGCNDCCNPLRNCSSEPTEIMVDLASFSSNGSGNDDCCDNIDGSYTLQQTQDKCLWHHSTPDHCPCAGRGTPSADCCFETWDDFTITAHIYQLGAGGNYFLQVQFYVTDHEAGFGFELCGQTSGEQYFFETDLGSSQPDCTTWSSLSLSRINPQNLPENVCNDGTVEVTSL